MAERIRNGMGVCGDAILDFAWPRITGEPEGAPKYDDCLSAEHDPLLDEIEKIVVSRLSVVEDHSRDVERKLMSLLTLLSILSALITAGLVAVAQLGRTSERDRLDLCFGVLAVVFITYIILQLLRSQWATISGLRRRGYRYLSRTDICPERGESKERFKRRILNSYMFFVEWNEWVVNQKVNEMTVAHTATRNALLTTFLLVGVIFLYSLAKLIS